MKSTEFLFEDLTGKTFTFKVTGDWKEKVWVTMFETASKDEQWLVGSEPYEVGEAVLEIEPKAKTVYFSRIDITSGTGQGKGPILANEVLRLLKARKFKSVTAYVNHNNPNSRSMFKKLGFELTQSDEWDAQYGDYWTKVL